MRFDLIKNSDGSMRMSNPLGNYIANGGGNPAYTATHWADPNGTASWAAAAVSSLTPCSIETALANASAGDQVCLLHGEYSIDRSSASTWITAYTPANAGSAGTPIVFFAENRAINTPTTSLRSRLTHTGNTLSLMGPTFGGYNNSYITWDGIWIDEDATNNFPAPDTGAVVVSDSDNIKILGCLLEGYTPTHAIWGEVDGGDENHPGVRVEGSSYIEVADCDISGFANPDNSSNASAIMTYSAVNCDFRHNYIHGQPNGIFIKGNTSGSNAGITVHHNWIEGCVNNGIQIGIHTSTSWSDFYQNIIIDCTVGILYGQYGSNDNQYYRLVNNTLARCNTMFACLGSIAGNVIRRNNIAFDTTSGSFYTAMEHDDFAGSVMADSQPDYECFYDATSYLWRVDGSSYTSLASLQAANGSYNQNSLAQDPQFVDDANDDFSLDTGSPCLDAGLDYLNLLGNGTSGAINLGADVGIAGDVFGIRYA